MSIDNGDSHSRGHSAVFEPQERTTAIYNGVNRRRTHRRGHHDRREEMRFDMDKPDRRDNPGRRSDDSRPTFW
jgi:hypothetical protein